MKNTAKRDKLITFEQRAQLIWERNKYFVSQPNQKQKYFVTFPIPYMNGILHLGHAFTITKRDFNARYKRLIGFNVLFPFGYHCTGMPIYAAAQKLKFELQTYGNPPKFPQGQKYTYHKFQYQTLIQMGIGQQKIVQFVDSNVWVKYFPPLGRDHIIKFGVSVDHNRSFITTELNPYYDSFVRWQFNLLKERGYIKHGNRASIYSPKDKQICADHERSKGEGVRHEQYMLIKMKIVKCNQRLESNLKGKNVFLAAVTKRPQLLYGQTGCFVLPNGAYAAVQMKNDEVFICSQRSALNMAYQGLTKQKQKVSILDKFRGEQLIGLSLSAPQASYKVVYVLPMINLLIQKGTGVQICVPSDNIEDWVTICDLKNKKNVREKYNLTEQMLSLEPVRLIQTIAFGRLATIAICQQYKIKNLNDKQLLEKAKNELLKTQSHEGIMIAGKYKGTKMLEARKLIEKQLIDGGDGLLYYQPGRQVISRSGDECVVSICKQWYINYNDEKWKQRVLNYAEKTLKTNNQIVLNELKQKIKCLKQWGCSRQYGLGTKIPFDQQYLIQPLSDSTIYFAYYTISHFLQGNIQGSIPGILGIKPQDLTHDFWSHIFLGKQYQAGKIPTYKLEIMRQSFLYWYPLDLRCSAKDLIQNHLPMALFHHAAIWEDEQYWPRAYSCNGYINIQDNRMSKFRGNFIILEQAIDSYGADSARLACAQAGDSIEDANFTKQNVNAAILQLSALETFLVRILEHKNQYRTVQSENMNIEFFDAIFENQIQNQINKVMEAYQKMIYRDVIKQGFHYLGNIKNQYLLNCGNYKPRYDLIERYIYLQLLFLYPICPHFCEVAYLDYFLTFTSTYKDYPKILGNCNFPKAKMEINYGVIKSHQYFSKFMMVARDIYTKVVKPRKGEAPKLTKGFVIYCDKYQDYQIEMLKILKASVVDGEIRTSWRNKVRVENKQLKRKMFQFAGFIEKQYKNMGKEVFQQSLLFSELNVLTYFQANIKKEFSVEIDIIEVNKAPAKQSKNWNQSLVAITPGNPIIIFQ